MLGSLYHTSLKWFPRLTEFWSLYEFPQQWKSYRVAAAHTMQIRVIKTLERGQVQELKFISRNRKWMSTDKRLLSRLRFVDVWSTDDSELQKYSLFRILISLLNTYTVAACLLFLKLYLYLEILPALKSLSYYWSRKCVMAVISNFRSTITSILNRNVLQMSFLGTLCLRVCKKNSLISATLHRLLIHHNLIHVPVHFTTYFGHIRPPSGIYVRQLLYCIVSLCLRRKI